VTLFSVKVAVEGHDDIALLSSMYTTRQYEAAHNTRAKDEERCVNLRANGIVHIDQSQRE